MPITGDRVSGTITITSIAETLSPFNNYKNGDQVEQWKMEATPWWNTKYPWFIYKNMYTEDRDGLLEDNEKPTMGRHQVLLGVGKLGKEEYDGQQLWMWNMWLDVLDYDGPDAAGTPTQASQQARTEAQPGKQVQSPAMNPQRFGMLFKMAVESTQLELGSLMQERDTDFEGPLRQWMEFFVTEADFLEGVYLYPTVISLTDDQAREAELQNQELPQRDSSEARPLPTQIQTTLEPDDLGWDDVPKKEQDAEGFVVPPNDWDYEDFKKAYLEAKINMTQIKKAFGIKAGTSVVQALENWCIESGLGYEDAFEHLRISVSTV